jgi:hypothetical protein
MVWNKDVIVENNTESIGPVHSSSTNIGLTAVYSSYSIQYCTQQCIITL